MLEHNGKIVQGNGFLIDDFTDHGLEFMEDNQDNPFFLYLPFNTPHTPFQVPDRHWEKYQDKDIRMRAKSGQEDIMETRAALAMCENIDENVGRIIAKTKALGIEDNTIVLFFSDNGPARNRWNGGLRDKKGSTNEGGVRSPLVMKWPEGIEAGKRIERIVSVTDLLPTLSDMCDISCDIEKPLDGISVKSTLTTDETDWEDRYIFQQWKEKSSVRSQKYRLSQDRELHDMENDRGQTSDLSDELPEVKAELLRVAEMYLRQKSEELPAVDERPFFLGHPAMKHTQIPARDGSPHGNIKRSNRWPNCSFFTNWTSLQDSITWRVEVPEDGIFRVQLYYTCPEGDEGSIIQLSVGDSKLESRITEPHDPPLIGMDKDITPRIESYVKDWKVADIGEIELRAGKGQMCLKALDIPANSVMDFRLLLFERLD
jgi:hypothetical protein